MKIAIEGAPGVGKSTLCQALLGTVPDSVWVEEPVAENPYLADYYLTPSRWALAMQVDILLRRLTSVLQISTRRKSAEFQDRSAWGDRLFAQTALRLGLLEQREFDTYDMVFRAVTGESGVLPDAVVYLRASADTLWERVGLRGRPEEASMTRPYLDAIQASYDEFFMHPPAGVSVIVVDWDTFGTPESVWASVERHFMGG